LKEHDLAELKMFTARHLVHDKSKKFSFIDMESPESCLKHFNYVIQVAADNCLLGVSLPIVKDRTLYSDCAFFENFESVEVCLATTESNVDYD